MFASFLYYSSLSPFIFKAAFIFPNFIYVLSYEVEYKNLDIAIHEQQMHN